MKGKEKEVGIYGRTPPPTGRQALGLG